MFNVFQADTICHKVQHDKPSDHTDMRRRKIKTEVLSTKYRARISTFVSDMAADPVYVKDTYTIRQEIKEKEAADKM